ncbi:hypothetical protein [Limoniibacter endophyticus]|uniref:Hemolysin XhlA n=1 Tax=Limoniibacter endophyticus TaxID=1565040 RepID=A0A8J3DL54_9HYPH|nr:hypothetical protein [Limoniibacter endophyticus]GHC79283.1 hypothetical protein GCM10010136_31710 [Limoniibacter endophyticus]
METAADLRSRVVALEQQGQAREQRLVNVENWQRMADIAEARKSEQFKAMDDRFSRIEGDLEKISQTLAKIMWLIIGGIITGMVAFIMRGGFSV